jgi:putative transposase
MLISMRRWEGFSGLLKRERVNRRRYRTRAEAKADIFVYYQAVDDEMLLSRVTDP